MDAESPAERIARYCVSAGSPTDTELAELKKHLLDWVSVVTAGYHCAESTPAVFDTAAELGIGSGDATILPTSERASTEHAALVNGTLAHSLDYDDTHRPSSLHPGAPVIAAALAAAETENASMDRVLRAVLVGYDVTCVLGEMVDPDAHYERGFHMTATCGTFGATAAVGVVRDFDAAQFEDAFGVNISQTAGSLQFLENGSWNKRLHAGLAAKRAVLATSLAANGFVGAAQPIDGSYGFLESYTDDPNPGAVDRLDTITAVRETGIKPYPCCRYAHTAIDLLRDVASTTDPADVERVVIEMPKPGLRLTADPIDAKRNPENFVDCQFSMPFCAAATLLKEDLSLDLFLDAVDSLDDPELQRLMDATTVRTADEIMERFPERWASRVIVETINETMTRFTESPLGEPENPLGFDGVTQKFERVGTAADLDDEKVRSVVDAVESIDEINVTGFVDRIVV